MRIRLFGLMAFTVLLARGVWLAWESAAAAPVHSTPVKPCGVDRPALAQLPAASCAASSCHGGGEVGRKGSEHSTWSPDELLKPDAAADPHARAFRVLFNDDSARMAKAVGGGPAYKNELCLKCHAVPDANPKEAVSEGVSCGGCHGQADGWLAAHVKPRWRDVPNRERWEKYGFAPTKNLAARTLICANCHVGDADREVNHDLIAAGHPRLAFEAARFHHRPAYRKHWTELLPTGEFEVRVWVVGQGASLRAAADLLRARASRAAEADGKTPWPEFAGQSCYACHHPIGDKPLSPGTRPLGVAAWEIWSTAAFEVAAAFTPALYPGVPAPKWDHLTMLKAEMNRVSPDAKKVAKLAANVVTELDAWLAKLQAVEDAGLSAPPADLPRKITHALTESILSSDRKGLADRDWDALAAHHLGVVAMYHASGGKKAVPVWAEPVRELAELLNFPAGYVSPKDFDDAKREKVRQRFAALYDATAEPEGKR